MGHRYIGTKTKSVHYIIGKIKSIVPQGSHISDLMCGTATVSRALKEEGYQVTASDVMTYSYHHAVVTLLIPPEPQFHAAQDFISDFAEGKSPSLFPFTSYELMILALNRQKPASGYFTNEFSLVGNPTNSTNPRNYFSSENAKKIDGIRARIRWLADTGKITKDEHSLLLHDLIMSVNDIANIAGTYGHYLSKLRGRALDRIELKPSKLAAMNGNNHRVILGYAEDLSPRIECDLCYIDPPYMKRQYAANYHVLETLAREDEPEAIGESGLRPWRDQYSDFCTKTNIRDAFRKIISQMKCPQFLISYSEDGLLNSDQLMELFSEFGKVEIHTFSNKRFKSNQSKLPQELREYLFHLRKK